MVPSFFLFSCLHNIFLQTKNGPIWTWTTVPYVRINKINHCTIQSTILLVPQNCLIYIPKIFGKIFCPGSTKFLAPPLTWSLWGSFSLVEWWVTETVVNALEHVAQISTFCGKSFFPLHCFLGVLWDVVLTMDEAKMEANKGRNHPQTFHNVRRLHYIMPVVIKFPR
jgi:hypothetical protein